MPVPRWDEAHDGPLRSVRFAPAAIHWCCNDSRRRTTSLEGLFPRTGFSLKAAQLRIPCHYRAVDGYRFAFGCQNTSGYRAEHSGCQRQTREQGVPAVEVVRRTKADMSSAHNLPECPESVELSPQWLWLDRRRRLGGGAYRRRAKSYTAGQGGYGLKEAGLAGYGLKEAGLEGYGSK